MYIVLNEGEVVKFDPITGKEIGDVDAEYYTDNDGRVIITVGERNKRIVLFNDNETPTVGDFLSKEIDN